MEIKERIEAFTKAYGELVAKHEVDYANYPVFVPDGHGGFKIIVQSTPIDLKDRNIASPFIAKE